MKAMCEVHDLSRYIDASAIAAVAQESIHRIASRPSEIYTWLCTSSARGLQRTGMSKCSLCREQGAPCARRLRAPAQVRIAERRDLWRA